MVRIWHGGSYQAHISGPEGTHLPARVVGSVKSSGLRVQSNRQLLFPSLSNHQGVQSDSQLLFPSPSDLQGVQSDCQPLRWV
jgi:hypothetical protein